MSQIPQYSYTWKNSYGNLVFELAIPTEISTGTPPSNMTLNLYSEENPDSKIFQDSSDGKIVLSDVSINDKQVSGSIWLNASSVDHGFVVADLNYGQSPFEQKLGGALAEYRF